MLDCCRRSRGVVGFRWTNYLSFGAKLCPLSKYFVCLKVARQLWSSYCQNAKMSKSARVASKLVQRIGTPVAELPVFLCPGLVRATFFNPLQCSHNSSLKPLASQRLITSHAITSTKNPVADPNYALRRLPQQCVGCGALSQTVDETGAGYFTPGRNTVRRYLEATSGQHESAEDELVKEALKRVDTSSLGISTNDFVKLGTFSGGCTIAILTLVQRLLLNLPSAIDATRSFITALGFLYIIPPLNLSRIQFLNLLTSTIMCIMFSMRQTFPCH